MTYSPRLIVGDSLMTYNPQLIVEDRWRGSHHVSLKEPSTVWPATYAAIFLLILSYWIVKQQHGHTATEFVLELIDRHLRPMIYPVLTHLSTTLVTSAILCVPAECSAHTNVWLTPMLIQTANLVDWCPHLVMIQLHTLGNLVPVQAVASLLLNARPVLVATTWCLLITVVAVGLIASVVTCVSALFLCCTRHSILLALFRTTVTLSSDKRGILKRERRLNIPCQALSRWHGLAYWILGT